MRFFRISTEPPAIIQPRQRRMQYSTSAAAVAGRAHDLHDFVRDFEADLIASGFRQRGFIRRRKSAIGIGRRAIEQKLRALELDRHVGEFPLQALEFAQRLAELVAHLRVLTRAIERIAPERERARGIADAFYVETRRSAF